MLEKISRREEADLFVAWVAISLAFAIIQIAPNTILGPVEPIEPLVALQYLVIAFVTVGIAFCLHEMAHKFTAMKFGYWAEFRKDNMMLLVAIALAALVSVVFAAPGATLISSSNRFGKTITKEEYGIISAAGPIVNLLLCIPFVVIFLFFGGLHAVLSGDILAKIGLAGFQINAMIAAFNMLPVSVLDGKKVLAWNVGIFVILIVAAFGALVVSFYPSIL